MSSKEGNINNKISQQQKSSSPSKDESSGCGDDEEVEIEVEELTPSIAVEFTKPNTSLSPIINTNNNHSSGIMSRRILQRSGQTNINDTKRDNIIKNEEGVKNQIVELLKKTIHNPKNPRAPSKGEINLLMNCNNQPTMKITSDFKTNDGKVLVNKISLLEKIIITHPVWYLRNIGRIEACHLLNNMIPGSFIVRSSTKVHSMALTIRLPPEFKNDNDHYLIETINGSVRLEGSLRSFKSLPLLIEYYCKHGEEIHVKLEMPPAIVYCNVTEQLKSFSKIGADFWNTELAHILPSINPRDEREMTPGPNNNFNSVGNNNNLFSRTSDYFSHNCDAFPNVASYQSNTLNSSFYSVKNSLKSGTSSSSTLSKNVGNSRPTTRSSTRSYKEQEKRTPSFLRSLFFGSNSNNKKQNQPTFNRSHSTQVPIKKLESQSAFNSLAQCYYFTPLNNNNLMMNNSNEDTRKSSLQSRLPLSRITGSSKNTNPRQSSQSSSGLSSISSQQQTSSNRFQEKIDDNRSLRNGSGNDIPSSKVSLTSQGTHKSNSSINTKSKIISHLPLPNNFSFSSSKAQNNNNKGNRGVKCFPSSSSNNSTKKSSQTNDFEEINFLHKVGEDSLRARQLAFRREISDVAASITAKRLANHLDKPDIINKNYNFNNKSNPDLLKDMSFSIGGEENILPYKGNNNNNFSPSKSIILRRTQNQKNHMGTGGNDCERNGKSQSPSNKDLHRLSVPNLVDQKNCELLEQHKAVANSAKALVAKLGRRDGELQTINEGLITPVVRRKQFNNSNSSFNSSSTDNTTSDYHKVFIDPKYSYSNNNITTKSPKTNSKWSAVNAEMKSRQRHTKVIPLSHNNPGTHNDGIFQDTPNSEYTPISDFNNKSSSTRNSYVSGGTDTYYGNISNNQNNDDDSISVAGTVFNEPWDSNIWENLLDLAKTVDENSAYNTPMIERANIGGTTFDSAISSNNTLTTTSQSSASSIFSEGNISPKMKLTNNGMVLRIGEKVLDEKMKLVSNNNVIVRKSNNDEEDISINKNYSPTSYYNNESSICCEMSESQTLNRKSLTRERMNSMKRGSCMLNPGKMSLPIMNDLDESKLIIQQYIETLSIDSSTIFGATLQRFIECTFEANETCPNTVIRNVRQFLTGMKNYLVKNGEKNLHKIIEEESAKLSENSFLDIDAILETVLYKLLLKPIKNLLYHLSMKKNADEHKIVTNNLLTIRGMTLEKLGISKDIKYNDNNDILDNIKICLKKMQQHYSPFKKLDNFLKAMENCIDIGKCNNDMISSINNISTSFLFSSTAPVNGEDLIRIIMFTLAKGNAVTCDIDTWYMWELLPQRVLTSGDTAFYISSLFSSIQMLKDSECIKKLTTDILTSSDSSNISSKSNNNTNISPRIDCLIRVAVPDEQDGTIRYHTFPSLPQMPVGKLNRIIGGRFNINCPEDYGLYILFDGYESKLGVNEYPDQVVNQLRSSNTPFLFAYKRNEAKIAWPKMSLNSN
uniref:SH2 domain-containing protein n=1 Tax=Parastrongyloides trichosuri TaxID=131310 RepID=A0A0N4ZAG7_PARTI